MIYISIIKTNNNIDQIDIELQTLNKYFKIDQKEKHIEVTLDQIIESSIQEVIGNSNKRIGKRKEEKIKESILSKIQSRYGKWANIMYFKSSPYGGFKIETNFQKIYVTEMGRLYGGYEIGEGIFFSTHSLDRFEERYADNIPKLKSYLLSLPRFRRCASVTSLDCLILFINAVGHIGISKWKNDQDIYLHCYPNVYADGILIAKKYEDLFVIKTFLDPDEHGFSEKRNDIKWRELNVAEKCNFSSIRDYLLSQDEIGKIK